MEPTLGDVSAQKSKPSADAEAAKEFLKPAEDRGLSLTSPNGCTSSSKYVLETALNEEMTGHLGHEKNRAVGGRESANIRRWHACEDGAHRGDRSGEGRGSPGIATAPSSRALETSTQRAGPCLRRGMAPRARSPHVNHRAGPAGLQSSRERLPPRTGVRRARVRRVRRRVPGVP